MCHEGITTRRRNSFAEGQTHSLIRQYFHWTLQRMRVDRWAHQFQVSCRAVNCLHALQKRCTHTEQRKDFSHKRTVQVQQHFALNEMHDTRHKTVTLFYTVFNAENNPISVSTFSRPHGEAFGSRQHKLACLSESVQLKSTSLVPITAGAVRHRTRPIFRPNTKQNYLPINTIRVIALCTSSDKGTGEQ